MTTPIALFVYNRPELTRKTIVALLANELSHTSHLYIFSDGPKLGASDTEKQKIAQIHNYCQSISGFASIQLIKSDTNKGLATSIIDGVSFVLQNHPKVIVLEDDLIVSPYFLLYMNDALNMYEHDTEVISIHAFAPSYTEKLPATFFVKGADCLGWGTWRRGWDLFEPNGQKLLDQIQEKKVSHAFDFEGAYPYTDMLCQQIAGTIDSWAIRWYASAFLQNKLTLHPSTSLVLHIGFGDNATHAKTKNSFLDTPLAKQAIQLVRQPFVENTTARQALGRALSSSTTNWSQRIKMFVHRIPFIPKTFNNRMYTIIKKILKNILPPGLVKLGRAFCNKNTQLQWEGDYPDWEKAKKDSSGYDDGLILEKAKHSLIQVREGNAAFERDSVLFDRPEYNWPFLASLLWVATQSNNTLTVLDFGGSLGSSYFQNKHLFSHLAQFSWNIVEQKKFVQCGKETFQTDILGFYHSIAEVYASHNVNIVVLSSVLQYIKKPYALIEEISANKPSYILLDRTIAATDQNERISVQTVPEHIYKASYPSWLFHESSLIQSFNAYESVFDFPRTKLTERVYTFGCLLKRKNI